MSYTARDPKFELICAPCRYNVGPCLEYIEIPGDGVIPAGKYRCERGGRLAKVAK